MDNQYEVGQIVEIGGSDDIWKITNIYEDDPDQNAPFYDLESVTGKYISDGVSENEIIGETEHSQIAESLLEHIDAIEGERNLYLEFLEAMGLSPGEIDMKNLNYAYYLRELMAFAEGYSPKAPYDNDEDYGKGYKND